MAKSLGGPMLMGGAVLGLAGIAAAVAFAASKPEDEAAARIEPQAVAQESAEVTAAPAQTPEPEAPKEDGPFVIKRILPIDGPIKYGEWHWDEENVPDGPIVITVDLDARVLSIFQGGYEIGATAVLLGTQEKPTPTGVFPITQKKRHHVSNLYDAPMPYMQRLTNDGISLHASEVEWGYASHGCIGMPEPFAAKVFSRTKLGDRVFITRGKTVGMGDSLVDS
ncbi:MAG: L,D-transpeptidase family protein [Sphingomonadaceae bacterium]|jgi:lipoprotein-anchoring transpeptidase ErfK/SrfK